MFDIQDNLTNEGSALYPWFEEHGSTLVHPEDLEQFKSLIPYGKVFQLVDSIDAYVCLLYGSNTFRVKPDLLKKVPQVRLEVGDKIQVRGKEGVGEIIDIMWHYKEAKPFFKITLNGKKKSNRYWEPDIINTQS